MASINKIYFAKMGLCPSFSYI